MSGSDPVKRMKEPFLVSSSATPFPECPNEQVPSKEWHYYSQQGDKSRSNTLKQYER